MPVVPALQWKEDHKCSSNRNNNPGSLNPVVTTANAEMVLAMGEAMVVAEEKIKIDL